MPEFANLWQGMRSFSTVSYPDTAERLARHGLKGRCLLKKPCAIARAGNTVSAFIGWKESLGQY